MPRLKPATFTVAFDLTEEQLALLDVAVERASTDKKVELDYGAFARNAVMDEALRIVLARRRVR
jgi:hypothetical protein